MAKAIAQLIDGEWRESRAREFIEVTDPATQDVLALAPKATADEIEQAIASAQRAFETSVLAASAVSALALLVR